MNKLTAGQKIALGTFLSSWQKNKSFDELMENEDLVGVWQPFENWPYDDVVDQITQLAHNIDRAIKDGR